MRLNSDGTKYLEIPCQYPTLGKTYFNWEADFDVLVIRDWMKENSVVPIVAVILYLILVFGGRKYMSDKPAGNWRTSLAFWNFGLSLFSWIGFFRVFPHILHNIMTHSTRDLICNNPEAMYGSGSTGFWVQMFILSKFPELIDTFFIVIHKKPLLLLHWYHHITVLLYCWFAYAGHSPVGGYFACMNYGVHAIMYGYYFLMAIRKKPKWLNAIFITLAQISQMVLGVVLTVLGFYFYLYDENVENPCWIKSETNIAAFLMYGSYLLLFLQFFFQRYQAKTTLKVKDGKKNL